MSAESGQVQFKTIGRPSALKIVGKGPAPKGQLNIDQNGNIKGQFDFELATLDTGIGLRDRHMKNKYLEVGKFPKAAITIQEMKFPNELLAKDGQKDAIPFKGMIKIRGIEKECNGLAKLTKANGVLTAEANLNVKVKDFNIDIPSFAGITMADNVDISVSMGGKLTQPKKSRNGQKV